MSEVPLYSVLHPVPLETVERNPGGRTLASSLTQPHDYRACKSALTLKSHFPPLIYQANGSNAKPITPTCAESSGRPYESVPVHFGAFSLIKRRTAVGSAAFKLRSLKAARTNEQTFQGLAVLFKSL